MPNEPKKFTEISVGDQASFVVQISEAMVNDFGRLSGDTNPLHMDQAYAEQTPFGQRVVHGMFGGALISQLIGLHLPGKYALYLKQTLTFKKPMFIGMEVTVAGEVITKTEATRTIELKTTISHGNEVLTEGQALVKVTQ